MVKEIKKTYCGCHNELAEEGYEHQTLIIYCKITGEPIDNIGTGEGYYFK